MIHCNLCAASPDEGAAVIRVSFASNIPDFVLLHPGYLACSQQRAHKKETGCQFHSVPF